MPIYEYYCEKCKEYFEKITTFGNNGVEPCPICGCNCEKVPFHPSGIIFKGSGFYVTDSKTTPRPPTSKPTSGGTHKTRKRSVD